MAATAKGSVWKWAPYQLAWLADCSPQKVALKSRRVGLSEVIAFECARRAVGVDIIGVRAHRPVNQNLISASHAQAKDLLRRVLVHVQALGYATPRGDIVESKSATIVQLTNGAFIRALSTNPRTIRSYEGDVTLDELGSMPNAEKVWAAAQPMAAPTLGNRQGYQIRAAGTPLGDDNLFYRICRGDQAKRWSLHEVSIHTALAQGFPIRGTIEEMRDEDPELFAQEYECSFMSASTRYISSEIYSDAMYDPADLPADFHGVGKTVNYGGLDLARTNDLTAWTSIARYVDTNWHWETDVLRGVAFAEQRKWVDDKLRQHARVAVDGSGMGMQFAEELVNSYPGLVESVTFNHANKEVFASGLKLALQKKRLRPRADDIELRREVLSMRREITEAGNVRYLAPRERGSHGDRAWSLALAEYASGGAAKRTSLVPRVYTPSQSGAGGGRVVQPSRRGAWR